MAEETLTITSAKGVVFDLTGWTDFFALKGMSGHSAPPYALVEELVPGEPGSALQHVATGARLLDIPLLVTRDTRQGLIDLERQLARELDPNLGDVMIEYGDPAGAKRLLTGRKIAGFAGDTSRGAHGVLWAKNVLTFKAPDPFWYSASPVSSQYTSGAAASTWFPIFPLSLASSEVFASFVVDNTGDVEAWPVWTIHGPGTAILLKNLTTGKLIDLPVTLLEGEWIQIDTRPKIKTVTKSDGSNLYGSMVKGTSSLWPLVRDQNTVELQMSGATGASAIELMYTPRYNSP